MTTAESMILVLVFVFFGGVTFLAYQALTRRRQRVEQRLDAMPSSDPTLGSTPELVLGDLTPALSGQIPMSDEDRTDLGKDLRSAGYYRPTALMEYSAVRAVLTFVPLVMGGIVALVWAEEIGSAVRVWLVAAIVALLGYSIPRVYLYLKAQTRRQSIERGLPTAIDMLTLCLSAGLNVLNSLQRVATELAMAYPDLSYELQIVRRQADLRSLEFALVQFAERVDLPQLRNISVILTQSEKLGADGITVLREYADNMRVNMKQTAEASANRAPIFMLLPGYLMGIGLLILLITPPAMEMAQFRRDNILGESKTEGRKSLEEAGLATKRATPPTTP